MQRLTAKSSVSKSEIQESTASALLADMLSGGSFDPFTRFTYLLKEHVNDPEAFDHIFGSIKKILPIINAFNGSVWSPLTTSDFTEKPQATRLNDLSAFAILGFDFKINQKGEIKLIEINGMNSGMKGFAKTGFEAGVNESELQRSDRALNRYLRSYGKHQLAFLGTQLALSGQSTFRLPVVKELVEQRARELMGDRSHYQQADMHQSWTLDYQGIADRLIHTENRLDDKGKMDSLFDGLRFIKPRSYPCSRDGLKRLLRFEDAEFIVMKRTDGSVGNDLFIERPQSLVLKKSWEGGSYILEPFVHSTEITSQETGDAHDGCMRYVALVEEDTDGAYSIKHFGGYWRLCPLPMSNYGELDAMRANLGKKALLEPCSDAHLSEASDAVELIVAEVWDSLTDMSSERSPRSSVAKVA